MNTDPRDEAFRHLLDLVRRFNRRPSIQRREEVVAGAIVLVNAYRETEEDSHIIEFDEGGWAIQHPLSCRPNLLDCNVYRAVMWHNSRGDGWHMYLGRPRLGRFNISLVPPWNEYSGAIPTIKIGPIG